MYDLTYSRNKFNLEQWPLESHCKECDFMMIAKQNKQKKITYVRKNMKIDLENQKSKV